MQKSSNVPSANKNSDHGPSDGITVDYVGVWFAQIHEQVVHQRSA
jgi:hypothetical protein